MSACALSSYSLHRKLLSRQHTAQHHTRHAITSFLPPRLVRFWGLRRRQHRTLLPCLFNLSTLNLARRLNAGGISSSSKTSSSSSDSSVGYARRVRMTLSGTMPASSHWAAAAQPRAAASISAAPTQRQR